MVSAAWHNGITRTSLGGRRTITAAMIGLGVMGLASGSFAQIWQPVPKWVPGQTTLAYLCSLISLGGGVGLLWRPASASAARVLFISWVVWLFVLRLPNVFYQTPVVLVAWTFGATAVMAAAAWVLYSWFADERERARLGFVTDATGVRAATILHGLSLIPFGLAHFIYVDATTVLIPTWLPWPAAWAYLTSTLFIAAGVAIAVGVVARLAVTLSAVQMGLFGLIVWVPRMLAGTATEFQRGEFITTCALAAGAWVVADSYRELPRLAGVRSTISGHRL